MSKRSTNRPRQTAGGIGVSGDVHGHLQLALCAWALEQQRSGRPLDAILLCGDVATFTDASPPDRATRRHAREDPCELEFLQWSRDPPAPWLEGIFADPRAGGLGLTAPVIMVHGNHEGFDHLARVAQGHTAIPDAPVTPDDLPAVDALGRIRYLPSGWRVATGGGVVVGGIGGIQPGHRAGAGYPDAAYIDERAVAELLRAPAVDVLLSHQGPARVHGPAKGAEVLDPLLDRRPPQIWVHGHARQERAVTTVGATSVVPLGNATFDRKAEWRVAREGWCELRMEADRLEAVPLRPRAIHELARSRWHTTPDGELVAPHLASWVRRQTR